MLIAQLSDLHVRPPGIPAARVVETNMLVERALMAVATLNPRPDVVVVSGDVTECGRPEEYRMAAELFRQRAGLASASDVEARIERQCSAHQRSEFFLTIAPLAFAGSTGSAVNPLAIF